MWKKLISTVVVAAAALTGAVGAAHAGGNVTWSVGIQAGPPVVYGPAPVYVAPQYYAPPPPRYYAPPPPRVVYGPPQVMWAPPPPPPRRGWERRHHHRHEWRGDGRGRGYRD